MPHSKIISGLDIGTSKITAIVSQYFEVENKLNVVAVASVPATGFRKGQIVNLEEASKTLNQCIESAERMAGFEISNLHISLAANYIESVNSQGVVAISNPNGEIGKDDIVRVIEAAKAISLPTGKEIIHVIPRRYTVDGQDGIIDPVGMNGIRLELEAHIILASTPALKNLHKCLEEIGITPISIIYSGLTTTKAAATETEKELGVAIVDIGGSITTITIYQEGSPTYSAVIPVGANNVTNDLAIGLRLSIDEAEKIKLRLGRIIENKKYQDEIELSQFGITTDENHKISLQTAVSGIIKPRLEEVFSLVWKQIEASGFSESIPAGVVLTGGGSLTTQTRDICGKIIPLPLRLASPPKIGGIVDEISNPAFTSTIGLILYVKDNQQPQTTKNKKSRVNIGGIFGRLKNIIEPLLP
ncbi:MAG: cell division protein FtsA [Candidatus Shapirobacteria bacterium]